MVSYVLCTTPRSGSTMLCDLLAATGVAGRPGSWLHGASPAEWCANLGLTLPADATARAATALALGAARAAGTGPGGAFGLRLQGHSLHHLRLRLLQLRPDLRGDVARLEAAFGPLRFVRLARGDRAAQAASYLRAEQTGLWHATPDGRELERLGPPRPARYDGAALRARHAWLTTLETTWDWWFAREGIAPLRLSYETLAADPAAALGRVLTHLDLDPSAARHARPGTARLADATSRDWADRLRREIAGA